MAFRFSCGKPERNEVEALNRLAAELPQDWALFTNIPRHLTGSGPRGREIDALALSPLGAVVIELKHVGGLITVMPAGEWYVAGEVLTDRQRNPYYPLQQAGKAAQVLKSALGAAAGGAYIEACAIATAKSAHIRFDDPKRPQPVMAMDDAVAGILALARRTRGVSHLSLQAFFALIGQRIPSKLDAMWREQAALRSGSANSSRASRPNGFQRTRTNNAYRKGARDTSKVTFGQFAIALIIGLLVGAAFLIAV